MKNFLLSLTTFVLSLTLFAQTNFTYTPEKPKPGDEIKFTYVPSGELAGALNMPELIVREWTPTKESYKTKIIEVSLKREYGKLIGKVKSDANANLLAFGFTIDDKFDTNNGLGYIVPLHEGDSLKKEANASIARFYRADGRSFGLSRNPKLAVEYYNKQIEREPDTKDKYMRPYLSARLAEDEKSGSAAIQAEIEKTILRTLKYEDYLKLSELYDMLRLSGQAYFFKKLKKEKFPAAELTAEDYWDKFYAAKELSDKEIVLKETEIAEKKAIDPEPYNERVASFQRFLLNTYASSKDWVNFRRFASTIMDKENLSRAFNYAAWKMQQDSADLAYAEEISRFATMYAKDRWKSNTLLKPDNYTSKQWDEERKNNYATYADTYAMVLFKMRQYKKALSYTKEAALDINGGKYPDQNTTYALVAERALSVKKYKPQLEQFVKNGKTNTTINDVLKRLYAKEKGGDAGFDNYIAALEKEAYNKMIADLKKEMLNEATPQFALKDLSGNTVNMADLKGKTVVVDFWATWCGPCIASMPGMKKMVNKYKDDPNVKFLFVDTWQNEDNETDVVKKFIADKEYGDFHVLMDLDDKVVSSFKVDGIPTKFIIGKDGNIKFKEVGFDGEENLVKKLPAMIELAN